jgi:hypothetical protein
VFGWLFGYGGQPANVRVPRNKVTPEPQIHSPPPNIYIIVDKDGDNWEYVEKELVDIGLSEGWLKLCGWHYQAIGQKEALAYRYKHIG